MTIFIRNSRQYSSKIQNNDISSNISLDQDRKKFLEWFRGFVDAEGYFAIITNRNSYSFIFGIGLHIDDLKVLEIIQQTLQIGKVYIRSDKAEFLVRRTDEVKLIIEIFTETPLNSNKQLNFLAFKKAFEIFTQTSERDEQLRVHIEEIRSSMNNNRLEFNWVNRQFNITPWWFLGFVEGDGSFSINLTKTGESVFLRFRFIITQSVTDLDLLTAIKFYINQLALSSVNANTDTENMIISSESIQLNSEADNYVSMYLTEANSKILKGKEKYNLTVQDFNFIKQMLLPFFDSLGFYTKKGLDYVDFKNILLLKDKGFHFTPEGLELIQLTLNQMNNNRLSTYSRKIVGDRELLLSKINDLLVKPSNLELKEDGKIFIKSLSRYYYNNTKSLEIKMEDESGSVVKTWPSLTSCAESLGLSKSGVQKRLKNATRFVFEGRTVYLNKY